MTTLIQKQRELFDKKFPFIPHDDNFGSDGSVTGGSDISQEVKSFLNTCLIEHYEEDIRELEGMRKEAYKRQEPMMKHSMTKIDSIKNRNFNSALSLAISLLQDKIKELKALQ